MNLKNYNITWQTQSRNSGESMPCGGYDIGANVWVEKNQLFLYIDRSGYFDENNQMLKTGRYRFSFSKPVFSNDFKQTLDLESGSIMITGQELQINIWMDIRRPICFIDIQCPRNLTVSAAYESWRCQDRLLPPDERHAAASYCQYPGDVITYADTIRPAHDHITFYHQNNNAHLLHDFIIKEQNLETVADRLYTPQRDFIFGGCLQGEHCTYEGSGEGLYAGIAFKSFSLKTRNCPSHHFQICFHAMHTPQFKDWDMALADTARAASDSDYRKEARRHAQGWWKEFWSRSYIRINDSSSDSTAFMLARNYTLFRYMLACNAYGAYPTKFNGGLFTTDPEYSIGPEHAGKTPDFRMWGGGSFTGQNQRLVYWNMLASGDFDFMKPQFDFYNQLLDNARLRTNAYWGHDGCSFTEQLENNGLPILWNWGFKDTPDHNHLRRPSFDHTEIRGPWIRYEYSSQLEFAYMILEYHRYTNQDISMYIPFIESCIQFYMEHYQMRNFENTGSPFDEDDKLVIFPSTALETYKNATNPVDAVSGLRAVAQSLTRMPQYVDTDYYQKVLSHLPELPLKEENGRPVIAPAESWHGQINWEIPQLYPVFPYRFYGLGLPDLQTAVNTWKAIPEDSEQKNYVSWHQDGIFTARMGLCEESVRIQTQKLRDSGRRFPAFWGPGHDWVPDHNWGGSGMTGLQEMLVQTYGNTVCLFPAWPRDWDVTFRLHLPCRAVINATLTNGEADYQLDDPAGYYKKVVVSKN